MHHRPLARDVTPSSGARTGARDETDSARARKPGNEPEPDRARAQFLSKSSGSGWARIEKFPLFYFS